MKMKDVLVNSLIALLATLLSLLAAELTLRTIRYGEQTEKHLDYRDSWRKTGLGPGGYLQENFAGNLQDGFGGTVRWQNNSQGFRNDMDFSIPPPENTYRILSMGDSFTGGYRVGQDETFSYLVEQEIATKFADRKTEVMISVIEDPLTGLYYLASRGASYSPDLVVLGITLGNDIAQTYWNMGPTYRLTVDHPFVEEINDWDASKIRRDQIEATKIPSGCLTPRNSNRHENELGPRWSGIYSEINPKSKVEFRLTSLFSRLRQQSNLDAPQTVISNWEEYFAPRLFDSNGLGMFLRSPPDEIVSAYDELFATLSAYDRFCKSKEIELLVVIFPQRFQIQNQDWTKTLDVYGLREECFDREIPNRRIMGFCRSNEIDCLDPTDGMKQRYEVDDESLYLPRHDMHWNARGHSALAAELGPAIHRIMTR